MPAHKKNPLQLVPSSITHNAARYKQRLEGAPDDDRELTEPKQVLLTFSTAWAEIVTNCPEGVLKQSDSILVERAARALMSLRNASIMSDMEGHVLEEKDHRTEKLLESLMARLGGSPADRGKITIPKQQKPSSDFD